jgi:hypothetical protein
MKVFTKETVPKRYHYFNNKRIGDILLDSLGQRKSDLIRQVILKKGSIHMKFTMTGQENGDLLIPRLSANSYL